MIWVPADRILEILGAHPRRVPMLHPAGMRRLSDLRSGRQEFISWTTAEAMLASMDLEWLRHIPRDKGGLADIYEDGAQYGAPDYSHTQKARPTRRRYASEEERLEARRRTYRESYRRRRERNGMAA